MAHGMKGWIGGAAAAALVMGALPLLGTAARADKDCGAFTVILSDGRSFSGDQERTVGAVAGRRAWVVGTYVEFMVDLDTFTMTGYTLTGANAPTDITAGERTVVFAAQQPELSARLTSGLQLVIKDEQVVLRRANAVQKVKIQAKDCTQGGIFKMELDRRGTVWHQLGDGFSYYLDPLGRVMFTNGTVVGRESPRLATLVFPAKSDIPGKTASRWLIQAGGRVGMVLGEDALQP